MKVFWWPETRAIYESLSSSWRKKYDDRIAELIANPEPNDRSHLYLERELVCNDRVHVDDHRLVYRIVRNFHGGDFLAVISIGHKPSAYSAAVLIPYYKIIRSLKNLFRSRGSSYGAPP